MHDENTIKRCPLCGIEKPHAEFNKNRSNRDGLQSRCRDCQRSSGSQWAREHPETSQAYYEAHREQKIKRATDWNRENKDRRAEITASYYQRHRDEIRVYWRSRREAHNAYTRKWRAEHAERAAEARRAYRKRYPEKHCQKHARRRARQCGLLAEQLNYSEIIVRDGMVCHICGEPIDRSDLHFDHIVPISKGGGHTADNVHVAHAACNLRKRAKLLPL